ncbi:hypothetical protein GW17_00038913 [Ensete ventricosum]|nr:hypothetical protein GW17_00038913 [Ensete ventricosum]
MHASITSRPQFRISIRIGFDHSTSYPLVQWAYRPSVNLRCSSHSTASTLASLPLLLVRHYCCIIVHHLHLCPRSSSPLPCHLRLSSSSVANAIEVLTMASEGA